MTYPKEEAGDNDFKTLKTFWNMRNYTVIKHSV